MDLHDTRIWITGASAGIGEALARELAGRGARLVLSARRVERLEALRDALPRSADHHVAPLDLGDADGLGGVAARVLAEAGPVDVLVNNGGITQRSRAAETVLDVDRRIMEVNYFGAVALTKAVLPSMLARRRGTIAVVSSIVGKVPTPKRTAYSASKHALHGFFDALRAEVHDAGVRVLVVCPGYVRTDISKHALRGDGTTWGRQDRSQQMGIPAERCARRIARALRRDEREVRVGGLETLAIPARRWLPEALFHRVLRRVRG